MSQIPTPSGGGAGRYTGGRVWWSRIHWNRTDWSLTTPHRLLITVQHKSALGRGPFLDFSTSALGREVINIYADQVPGAQRGCVPPGGQESYRCFGVTAEWHGLRRW